MHHTGRGSAKLRDLGERHELMRRDVGLLVLGPALGHRAMVADLRFGPKFAHDEEVYRDSAANPVLGVSEKFWFSNSMIGPVPYPEPKTRHEPQRLHQ
jgi:hypothetical protein